ncbi:hypothetical protein VZG28_14560 (plasmid) [Synechococcus elongatus IITB4]|uniref:Uncharacterized protein n=1 Tax=Synechococcus elongatus PCC 11801 TaxID=2219813 RepID=A0ACD5A311_SYNEL
MKQKLLTMAGEQILMIDCDTPEELGDAWGNIEAIAAANNISTKQIRICLNGRERISYAEFLRHTDGQKS